MDRLSRGKELQNARQRCAKKYLRAAGVRTSQAGQKVLADTSSSKLCSAQGVSGRAVAGAYDADVVILAGTVGHEAHWSRGLPRTLLPLLPGQTVLRCLLHKLALSLDGTITICANGSTEILERHVQTADTRGAAIKYYRDNMPRGTGGCIKASAGSNPERTIFVAGGAAWTEEDPQWMLAQHRAAGNAITVFCAQQGEPGTIDGHRTLTPTGFYCVEPSVLPHIRDVGYQDLKEQVIPAVRAAHMRVGAVVLRRPSFEIANWNDYMRAVARSLATDAAALDGYRQLAPGIWCGENVSIDPTARIVGPALIDHGCRLASESLVMGPTILGRSCQLERGAWTIRSIAPPQTRVPAGTHFTDTLLPVTPAATDLPVTDPTDAREVNAPSADARSPRKESGLRRLTEQATKITDFWLPAGVLCVAFIWAFGPTFGKLWHTWQTNADYSAGQLVPLAALYMMASRRSVIRKLRFRFWSGGLLAFGLGATVHLFGAVYMYGSLENAGTVICAIGILMSILGRDASRRLWYPLLFLFLMLPLPHRVHLGVLLPLQDVSARVSATVLEMLAIPVSQTGHVLEVAGHKLAVAEACSGLRLALAFLIVTGVVVYVVKRPRWQKVLVLLSSIPIAVACNAVRIVGSAWLYNAGHESLAQGAFHDGAGLLMMPVALLLIYLEFRMLQNLAVPPDAMAVLVERVDRRRVVSGS